MQYTYEKGEKNTMVLHMEFTPEEVSAQLTKVYEKTKGKYQLPGFRKGKVPRNLIEKNWGPYVFYDDAINNFIDKHYPEILDKEKEAIHPIAYPTFSIDSLEQDGSIKLSATVEVLPEVTLGQYTGLTVEKNIYTVSDEDVEKRVKSIADRDATYEQVEGRACQNEDKVTIDYSGKIDGVLFDGGTAENQTLELGSGTFIPGFEDQVVGMNIDETKDINVKFPEDYGNEDLKGKDAVFTITLHKIEEKKTPELTDEYVKTKTGEETLEAYRAKTKAEMEKTAADRSKTELQNKLLEMVVEGSTLEVPQVLVGYEVDDMVEEFEQRLSYNGITMKNYLTYLGKTEDEIREDYKPRAEMTVKYRLVVDELRKVADFNPTEDEINAKLAERAESMNKKPEDMADSYKDSIRNSLEYEKMLDYLVANNNVVEKKAEE